MHVVSISRRRGGAWAEGVPGPPGVGGPGVGGAGGSGFSFDSGLVGGRRRGGGPRGIKAGLTAATGRAPTPLGWDTETTSVLNTESNTLLTPRQLKSNMNTKWHNIDPQCWVLMIQIEPSFFWLNNTWIEIASFPLNGNKACHPEVVAMPWGRGGVAGGRGGGRAIPRVRGRRPLPHGAGPRGEARERRVAPRGGGVLGRRHTFRIRQGGGATSDFCVAGTLSCRLV